MKFLLFRIYITLLVCAVFCGNSFGQVQMKTHNEPITITAPPKELNLDPFYKKYICANGIHIISSNKVPDKAIFAVYNTIVFMTDSLPSKVLNTLKIHNTRVAVMARYEGTTDIPEHAYLANDTTLNWDVRARGLGGTLSCR